MSSRLIGSLCSEGCGRQATHGKLCSRCCLSGRTTENERRVLGACDRCGHGSEGGCSLHVHGSDPIVLCSLCASLSIS